MAALVSKGVWKVAFDCGHTASGRGVVPEYQEEFFCSSCREDRLVVMLTARGM